MKRLILIFSAVLAAAAGYAQDQGQIRVVIYPMEAVVDSAKLSHAAFKERYPGIDVIQYGLSDEGYYIRYTHEGLVYLFGPTDDVDYARQQKAYLEQIRLSAVLKKPSLSTSSIEIIHFDFADGSSGEEKDNPYLVPEDEWNK